MDHLVICKKLQDEVKIIFLQLNKPPYIYSLKFEKI